MFRVIFIFRRFGGGFDPHDRPHPPLDPPLRKSVINSTTAMMEGEYMNYASRHLSGANKATQNILGSHYVTLLTFGWYF